VCKLGCCLWARFAIGILSGGAASHREVAAQSKSLPRAKPRGSLPVNSAGDPPRNSNLVVCRLSRHLDGQ